MPNTIKVKRGKSAALNTSTEKLQAGEILYNLDKNYLTVGAEDNDALTKKPVAAREIVGYTGDTDSKIGASTTEAYSIKYDTQLKIKDGDNTLLVPKKNGTLATTEDITASASTKLDNTNEDKIALKNNKSLSYTSDATASTVMSRDANGRAKVADGAAAQDIATVGQLNTGLNAKVTKPVNPTVDSAITIDSSGAISTKSLASITGKLEVAVSSTAPTEQSDEILWINPDGTSSGGGSSGGGKLYRHDITLVNNTVKGSQTFQQDKLVYKINITLLDRNGDEINNADKLIARFDNYICRSVVFSGIYEYHNSIGGSYNVRINNLESTSKIISLSGSSIGNYMNYKDPIGISTGNSYGWILKTFSGSTYTADNITYTDTVTEV